MAPPGERETTVPVVLIADDEPVQRRLARAAVERLGMRAIEAADGATALQAFERERPDLVLLDVIMPGMNGYEACAALRRTGGSQTTPILIMTSLNDNTAIEQAYECGATDFISKPVNWDLLGRRLRYMLRAARVTEALIRAEARIVETRTRLLQSEKMASLGQLAAGVAHEINNPIGYVQSNLGTLEAYLKQAFEIISSYEQAEHCITDAQALARITALKRNADLTYLTEDVFALMKESREGISRVSKIAQDLKRFSHMGTGNAWSWADVHEGLESTINIVNNEIKYKAQLIKDYGVLPPIQCLPSQLNQVFLNMLVNAAHAIEDKGTITVRSGLGEANHVWLEFSDTGAGIAPEHLNRIFDPFFTTKAVGKGTGLGLSLSYGIVKEHHGRIEVDSTVGMGTTFRIVLPVSQPTAGAVKVAA